MKKAKGRPTSIYLYDDVKAFLDAAVNHGGTHSDLSRSELINAIVRKTIKNSRRVATSKK